MKNRCRGQDRITDESNRHTNGNSWKLSPAYLWRQPLVCNIIFPGVEATASVRPQQSPPHWKIYRGTSLIKLWNKFFPIKMFLRMMICGGARHRHGTHCSWFFFPRLPSLQGSWLRGSLMRLALLILAMGCMNPLQSKGLCSHLGP